MPRRHSHGFRAELRHELFGSPGRFLTWLSIFWLGITLCACLMNLGGYLFYGYPMVTVSWMVALLALLHAGWRLSSHEGSAVHPWALAPVPFLMIAALSQWLLSPEPWVGELHLWSYLQAYVIFFVVVHQVRHRKQQFWLLGILVALASWALVAASFQFYVNPDWFPLADRARSATFEGRAAGFLAVPDAFAALMLLFLPFLFLSARMRRFPGPVRILCGFLTVAFSVGALIAVSRPVLLAMVLTFILLPTFAVGGAKRRFKLLGWLVLSLAILLPLFYFTSHVLKETLLEVIAFNNETARPILWRAAVEMFFEHPVFGAGLGAFHGLWSLFQYSPLAERPHYVHSDYLQLMAELGIVGGLAVLVPWFWFLLRALRVWVRTPFRQVSEEQLFRESHGSRSGEELRARRRSRRRRGGGHHGHGPAPSQKIVIGGLFLGLLAFTLQEAASFNVQMPIVLFMVVAVIALLIQVAFPEGKRELPFGKAGQALTALLFVLAASGFFLRAKSVYAAQGDFSEASERLSWLVERPERVFEQPHMLRQAEAQLAAALERNPGHGEAWSRFAEAALVGYYADYSDMEGAAERAYPRLMRALELQPHHYANHLLKANVLAALGAPFDVVEPALQQAVELAPNEPIVYVWYANFVTTYTVDYARAETLLESALALDPHLEPARILLDDLKLR